MIHETRNYRVAREAFRSGQRGPGMSLRDWFAGQALTGFTSCDDGNGDVLMGAVDTARAAYNYADAMLAARGAS